MELEQSEKRRVEAQVKFCRAIRCPPSMSLEFTEGAVLGPRGRVGLGTTDQLSFFFFFF